MISRSVPRIVPGGPGIEARWRQGGKAVVGFACSASTHVRYTLDCGCVTGIYCPSTASSHLRDLQFPVTDDESFSHDERRRFVGELGCIPEAAFGFQVTNREKQGRYSIHKTILGDRHQNCLLLHTRVDAPPELPSKLRMYILGAPHLETGGWHNNGEVLEIKRRKFLAAQRANSWLVIEGTEFTLGLAFGRSTHTGVDIEFVGFPSPPIPFTFPWLKVKRREGQNYTFAVWARTDPQSRKESYGELADRVA